MAAIDLSFSTLNVPLCNHPPVAFKRSKSCKNNTVGERKQVGSKLTGQRDKGSGRIGGLLADMCVVVVASNVLEAFEGFHRGLVHISPGTLQATHRGEGETRYTTHKALIVAQIQQGVRNHDEAGDDGSALL